MKKERKFSFRGKVVSSDEKYKKANSSFGYLNIPTGFKMFTIEEGTKSIDLDFLPYIVTDPKHPQRDDEREVALPDSPWLRRPYKVHRNIGANKISVVCPTSIGKKCPICEYQNKRFKENADKEELTALRAKERSLYVVVPIGSKKYPEEMHIWDMSDALFHKVLKEILDENEDYENFAHPTEGRTATLRVRWEQLGTNTYPEIRDVDFTDDREPYDWDFVESGPKLDDMLKILSYEELYALLWDEEDAGDLKPIEVAEPVRERRRQATTPKEEERSARRKPEPKEEEEEKEEKPARRRPVSKEEEPEPEVKKAPVPKRGSVSGGKSTELECPYDHVFGEDTDDFKECDRCEIWNQCIDAKEKR